ncbi:homogentisate 1,2-dioxygenase [bacterium]|nr:homogentisate 1,2-dioxygenase [bacterium]
MYPQSKGKATTQAHVGLPEGTYEDEHGRKGFFGRVSHLYHTHQPTDWIRIEGPLKPRALDTAKLTPSDATDALRGLPETFMYNDDVALKISRLNEPMPYWLRNADGDDVIFVHRGEGTLECDFGVLDFERGDYLVIPKGTTYRLLPRTTDNFFLFIESKGEITLPDRGPLGPNAVFDWSVLKSPEPAPVLDAPAGEYEVRIKREGVFTSVFYPYHPMDVVGWKGDLSVWKLNVRDIRPVMSHRYHLPPSVHTTFLGGNFVICTFVPRPFESDPEAMRVPFYHRNIDYDEVIFYHDGDFFSRQNIGPAMVTFHPAGIHHGPHPKAAQKAAGKEATDEIAVMVDTKNPLKLTDSALATEWAEYHLSWRVTPEAATR